MGELSDLVKPHLVEVLDAVSPEFRINVQTCSKEEKHLIQTIIKRHLLTASGKELVWLKHLGPGSDAMELGLGDVVRRSLRHYVQLTTSG